MLKNLDELVNVTRIELSDGTAITCKSKKVSDLLLELTKVNEDIKRLKRVKENILNLVQECHCKNN